MSASRRRWSSSPLWALTTAGELYAQYTSGLHDDPYDVAMTELGYALGGYWGHDYRSPWVVNEYVK